MDDFIGGLLARFYASWYIADALVLGLSVLASSISSGWSGGLEEIIVSFTGGLIPFPVNLLAGWEISPFSMI